MATAAVSASSATGAVDAKLNTGRTRMAENFETFLTLLTSQLKNQDPLAPMDGNQFTQQLVQMTSVEQQLLSNELLKSLVNQGSRVMDGAVDLLGKTVTADRKTAELGAAGTAEWTYELPRDAASATMEIKNPAGQVIWSGDAPELGAGRHTIEWDGMVNGSRMPKASYSLTVTARSAAGATIPAPVNAFGEVTGVEQIDGKAWLTVNGVKVSMDAITSVRAKPVVTAPVKAPITAKPAETTPETPVLDVAA